MPATPVGSTRSATPPWQVRCAGAQESSILCQTRANNKGVQIAEARMSTPSGGNRRPRLRPQKRPVRNDDEGGLGKVMEMSQKGAEIGSVATKSGGGVFRNVAKFLDMRKMDQVGCGGIWK
jgi:hypothetical protein